MSSKRAVRPRAPVVVAPLAVSQLNCEAVAGINARRFLDWLAAHPAIPRARVGKLVLVEASVLLAHLAELATGGDERDDGDRDDERDDKPANVTPDTVDGVLAALGRRRTA